MTAGARRWRRRLVLTAVAVAVLGVVLALNTWRGVVGWSVTAPTPEALAAKLRPAFTVTRPPGDGPCGYDHAQRWRLICSGQLLTGSERAGDVAVALDAVRAMAFVDPDRLALIGASHGGWAVLDLLALHAAGEAPPIREAWPESLARRGLAGVNAAVLFYPYCGPLSRAARAEWDTPPALAFFWWRTTPSPTRPAVATSSAGGGGAAPASRSSSSTGSPTASIRRSRRRSAPCASPRWRPRRRGTARSTSSSARHRAEPAQKLPNTVPRVISTTSAMNGITIAAIARSK